MLQFHYYRLETPLHSKSYYTDILTAFFIEYFIYIRKHRAFTSFLLCMRPVPDITKDIFFLLLGSRQQLGIRHPQVSVIKVSSIYRNQCDLRKASKGFQEGEGIPLLSSCLV